MSQTFRRGGAYDFERKLMLKVHRELRERTEAFSFRVLRLVKALPQKREADVFGKQLLRSATSVAANYRAVNCCRTKSEFVNKLRLVLEEADETVLLAPLHSRVRPNSA